MSHPSAFKTPEGEATYLAAYDAALTLWPVAYEEMNISTRFGLTHVVVSGPKDAPALVLLHGYMATLIMWLPKTSRISAKTIGSTPSTLWVNPARASQANRSEMSQITWRG